MTSDEQAVRSDGVELGTRLLDRFLIRAQLGAGGFGTVYAAEDLERGGSVAIKRLTRVTGATIYRFKREFRALADREHPNLVRFHELFSERGEWFFSMELVSGQHFDTYVLGSRPTPQQAPTELEGSALGNAADVPTEDASLAAPGVATEDASIAEVVAAVRPPPARGSLDLAKLRDALAQLVAGIRELHAAGVVHRDLKPANVLVTPAGRVVLLDFGLATESDPDAQKSVIGLVMGTPTYMAPEQALGRATTEAADWYSLGVMLFEVLHGRPPFTGTRQDVLTAKLAPSTWRWPPPPPGAEDLDALCRALLRPEPEARPRGEEIAAAVAARPFLVPEPRAHRSPRFIGRERELAALAEALDAVEGSRTVVVRVHGQSGVGKTALLRHFVQRLGPEAVVLQGRCYERESVPYKTLDGVVDALTRYLGRLSVEEASLLVPREAQALCRLFPVFGRLRLLADQPERRRSSSPHEERRRGFAALREVLARMGDRHRLVVAIDDLQWGDVDSIFPLAELLAGPDAPRVLLLLVHRSSDADSSPALRALRQPAFLEAVGDVRELELGPLDETDAIALAESLLPSGEHDRAVELARESRGIPFFVPELVRAQRKTGGAPMVSLEQAMHARVRMLSTGARRLLYVVVVAGRPVSFAVACDAAQLGTEERQRATEELVKANFLRNAGSEDSLLEPFHDRVRESVVADMPHDVLRGTHEALATALAASGAADPEALAEHYRLAGRITEARAAAVSAAERATDAFAFERAVALYRVAQDEAPSDERRVLTGKLGDVLAYAGRGREAAAAYLEAVDGASHGEARELRRRAAEQLLRCGAIDEGIALIRALLAEAGIPYPQSRGAVIASVAAQRALLALRGFAFTARPDRRMNDDDVARVDLSWTLGACLSPIDVIRGADFITRHMRAALALGDPYRIARGMALISISYAMEGGRAGAKGEKLARRAAEIAHSIDHPHAIGWSLSALASAEWYAGHWRRSLELSREATSVFRTRSPESVWEVALPEILLTTRSLFFLGELSEFRAEAERCTVAATERGDELIVTTAQSVAMSRVHLLSGRPDEARRVSAQGISRWSRGEWHLQHQEDLRAQLLCDLYEGDGKAALARIAATWDRQQASLLLRTQPERIQSFSLFASAAIHAGDPAAALHWHKKLAKEDVGWGRALAVAARAGILALQGDPSAADTYERAEQALMALEMPLFAAAARRRRGELLGGAAGQALANDVGTLLSARGVVEPDRWSRMLVP